jgi:hypothetical protein
MPYNKIGYIKIYIHNKQNKQTINNYRSFYIKKEEKNNIIDKLNYNLKIVSKKLFNGNLKHISLFRKSIII